MAITSVNDIKQWFRTNLFPTESQFWNWLDSFRHKSEAIPMADVTGLVDELQAKANADQLAVLNNVIVVAPGEYSKVIPAGTLIRTFWVMADVDIVYSVGTAPGGTDIIDNEATTDTESVYDKKVPCKNSKTLYFTGTTGNTTIIILKQ